MGLVIASITVFLYFYIIVYFDYIESVEDNRYIDYDVKTITASDYTVEFEISDSQYNRWKNQYLHDHNPMSELA